MKSLIPLITLLLFSCKQNDRTDHALQVGNPLIDIRYATGFKVSQVGNCKSVIVTYPFQGAASGYEYLLVPKGEPIPEHNAATRVVRIPVSSVVSTSTTHIPLLDYLGETDALTGFTTTDYVSSEKMRARIDSGFVTELGVDNAMNLEKLVMLQPDVVFGYTMTSDYGQFKKVEALGIPVVINAEYLEKHPLGRAEWIKFMSLFFNKEKEADSIFSSIERNYFETKQLVDSVSRKPEVLSGIVYGDAWFMPGGENYASRILKDAACTYVWGNNDSNGFLQLSFEQVYERAYDADLWIGTGTYGSLAEIKANDERYARFKAFKTGNVYNYDARLGAKGGSEFLELGYLRPDIILKDLVKIAHPKLLPEHNLYFYRKLK